MKQIHPMTIANNDRIAIPLNFKIACTIYDLPVPKVLQFFITHVSFYDSLSNGFNGAYSNATNTMISCPGKIQSPNTALLPYREMIIKSIRQIIALSMQQGLSETKKKKQSIPIINSLYKSLSETQSFSKSLYLDEKNMLKLTNDFCIFCEIHDCSPKTYLEHFMNKISLADASARIRLNLIEENQAMAFFSKLSKGYGKLSTGKQPSTLVQADFFHKMETIQTNMSQIKDLGKQRKAYQELYYAYYLKLLRQADNYYEN